MKSLSMILLTGLALAGCQNNSDLLMNPQAKPQASVDAKFQKTADLEGTLQEIAQSLAQEPAWLNARLANEMQRDPVSISRLRIQAPSRLESAGRVYDVTVEAVKNAKLTSTEPVRVAPDPERFYADESSFTAYVFDHAQNRVVLERIEKSAVLNQAVAYPLVLVTLQDRTEISFQEMSAGSKIFQEHVTTLAKGSVMATANSVAPFYLAITKIRLHRAHDDVDFEEFELYVKEGNSSESQFLPTTIHKFDGVRRLDAAGRMVHYPDVNVTETTYVFKQPIALWPLSNTTPISIAPLEDDCSAGQHKNLVYPNPYIKTYAEEYHRATNSMRYGERHGYRLAGFMNCGIFGSNDDTYDRGTFSDWTASNTPEQEISIDLGDLQIWVKKLVTLPPAPKVPLTEE